MGAIDQLAEGPKNSTEWQKVQPMQTEASSQIPTDYKHTYKLELCFFTGLQVLLSDYLNNKSIDAPLN